MEPAELNSIKVQIGQVLLHNLDETWIENNIFMIVDLIGENSTSSDCNKSGEHDNGDIILQPKEIATVYLKAGKRSLSASAFKQATTFLEKGIRNLPSRHWETLYELSLELYSSGAEAEFTIGRYEKTREYSDAIIAHEEISLLDKRRAYNAILNSMKAEGRMNEARILLLNLLRQLGVKFPKRGLTLHVFGNVIRTRVTIKTSTEKLSTLDVVSTVENDWIMQNLDQLMRTCYQTDLDLMSLAILRGYQYTVKNGLTKYAPSFLAMLGLLSVAMGDFTSGKSYIS